MRALRLIVALLLALPLPVYAAQPEDKGKDKDKPEQSQGRGQEGTPPGQQDRTPPGQERREDAAEQAAQRAEARAERAANRTDRHEASRSTDARLEQQGAQHERQAQERLDRNTRVQDQHADQAGDHRQAPAERGREHAQVASLMDSLTQLDHARWSHNPHDTRGQGNMGQPTMRDPFGFDRDSGREGRDRGRPIQESEPIPIPEDPPVMVEPTPSLNLEGLVTAEVSDPYLGYLQDMIAWAQNLLSWATANPTNAYATWMTSYASSALTHYQEQLTSYQANPPTTYQAVLYYGDPIEYSLTFQPFEGMDGNTFIVTTQLVSAETTSVTGVTGDYLTTGTQAFSATYETGQVLIEQTQELTLNQDGTYSFSLDPSAELLNGGYFYGSQGVTANVVVTITDPDSGASYTMTLDNQIRLIDPYGIVYDNATGRPIAGATVAIHNTNGSVVTLDRSANPHVSNPQTTDATGRYSCKLAAGKYYLTVKAPGYDDYKSRVFSEGEHIVREDVAMTRVKNPMVGAPAGKLPVPAVSPVALPVK